MNIVGLDLSLTSTGLAHSAGVTHFGGGSLRAEPRLVLLRAKVVQWCHVDQANLVVIEGVSFGSPNQAAALGELAGVVKVALHEHGIPFVLVAPGTLKIAATGKGSSKKEAVLAEAIRRLGYDGSSNDEADALWLQELGRQAYGISDRKLPKEHLRAVTSVSWPELGEKACAG